MAQVESTIKFDRRYQIDFENDDTPCLKTRTFHFIGPVFQCMIRAPRFVPFCFVSTHSVGFGREYSASHQDYYQQMMTIYIFFFIIYRYQVCAFVCAHHTNKEKLLVTVYSVIRWKYQLFEHDMKLFAATFSRKDRTKNVCRLTLNWKKEGEREIGR